MAVKYLSGNRLWGTDAERLALTITGSPPQTSWKELNRTTLDGTGDDIDVSFTAKDNLMFLSYGIPDGVIQWELGFGTAGSFDTGTNCATSIQRNGIELTPRTSQDTVESEHDGTIHQFCVGDIRNIASQEKLCLAHEVTTGGVGVTNVATRVEIAGKYVNTSAQVNFLRLGNPSAGDYAADSELVVLGCDDNEANSGTNFWQELGTEEASGGENVLSVTLSSSKKYLMFDMFKIPTGATSCDLQFNGDDGDFYNWRQSTNGGTDGAYGTTDRIGVDNGGYTTPSYSTGYIINIADQEKLATTHSITQMTAGAGYAPVRRETVGKWTDTDIITSVDMYNPESGNFASGSRIRVWGHD